MQKSIFYILTILFLLSACSSTDDAATFETTDKELTDKSVELYMHKMTSKYATAHTSYISKENRLKYLNEAITDINLVVNELKDEYDQENESVKKLIELSEALLNTIDYEMIDDAESAYDYAYDAGVLIKELSDNHTDGNLPEPIQRMIEHNE